MNAFIPSGQDLLQTAPLLKKSGSMADEDEWKVESGLCGTTWKFNAKDNRVKEEEEEQEDQGGPGAG